MTMTFRAGWLAFAMFWMAHPVLACGVCIERPEDILSDLLLDTNSVVVAHEEPTRPFRFGVTKVLTGSAEGGTTIPFLVDSATRRKLELNASDVRDRIAAALHYGTIGQLGAWATALVEIDGVAGVERLAAGWFDRPDSRAEDVRDVVSALALHGRYGDPALRQLILEELASLPSLRPDVVGSVATALGNIGDYTRTDAIRSAVARAPGKELTRIDSAELFAASSYVYRARQIASMTARSDQENR